MIETARRAGANVNTQDVLNGNNGAMYVLEAGPGSACAAVNRVKAFGKL